MPTACGTYVAVAKVQGEPSLCQASPRPAATASDKRGLGTPAIGMKIACLLWSEIVPASGSWVKPPTSKPAGWWNCAVVRSTAPNSVSERVSDLILASSAGLKWIESRPGGSDVTALPSDMPTAPTAKLSG